MASHRRIEDGEISRLLLETSDEETLESNNEIEDTLLQDDVQSDGEDCEVSTISQSPNTENDPGALPSVSLPPDVPNYVIVPQHQSLRDKDGHRWTAKKGRTCSRVSACNIIRTSKGPTRMNKCLYDPI
ncbi:hypothetical protein EVAR_53768_1 [Eumeta japonica]|uniref:PiggyBac transposable element-derived protein domain-containing protein n=1 Tax=Eumeta variegata TaxID=151549 RepID=A0A4C1Z3X8_EUMVA|nr:hypothetical protein EVAR_53768_1 [Eumeta japonica]